ncbi:hypothetical protein [Nocardioides sp.]|uniref:hypothetical protein n=1 Tax=Nocardioides sp. TaxID=35761 RepID=UPI002ED53EC6
MGARGLGLLLLLALLGGTAGWAWAEVSGEPTASQAVPEQPAAQDPAVPYTPPEVTSPDSDLPPLSQQLTAHDEKLGVPGQGGVVVPVPNGWERTDLREGEARWTPPGDPPGSYSVRAQVVDMQRSLAQAVAERAASLPGDPRISDLRILDQGVDTLRAEFILNGYRRFQVTRWVSFDGNGIDVEISATGRLIDELGLDALVAKLATEVFRQQPHDRRPGSLATPPVSG